VIIGGHVEVGRGGEELLLPVLSRLTHVAGDAAAAAELRRLLQRLLAETTAGQPGAAFAAAQYAQLLLVQVLRLALAQQATIPPGWLRLLADPALRPALTLLHQDPARNWSLDELARAAGLGYGSESSFSHAFARITGTTPGRYRRARAWCPSPLTAAPDPVRAAAGGPPAAERGRPGGRRGGPRPPGPG
jgi:AraC-like DNA-binding protein